MKTYTDTHEWIEIKDNIGTVGISSRAQKELGEIVYVTLPEVGQELVCEEEACVVESTKAATDIYSPVSGKVIAVNSLLEESPSLINTSPENDGWLFKIAITLT